MQLKTEILLGLWVVTGLLTLAVGVINLRFADAAWARHEQALEQRGLAAKRTKRWERSRVFTGTLTVIIGVVLLVMSGWIMLKQSPDLSPETITFTDPVSGKTTTRQLTTDEQKQFHRNRDEFIEHLGTGEGVTP